METCIGQAYPVKKAHSAEEKIESHINKKTKQMQII